LGMAAEGIALDDVDLAVECDAGGPASEPQEGYEFEVVAQRGDDGLEPLGVDVMYRRHLFVMEVIAVKETGLVPRWNASRRERSNRVCHGDYIMAVNGRSGSVVEMVEALKCSGELRLLVRRLKYFEVFLERVPGQKLGLTIAKDCDALIVAVVSDEGVVPDWNRAHPDRQLLVGDTLLEAQQGFIGGRSTLVNILALEPAARIFTFEVNGVSGTPYCIMQVMAQEPPAPKLRIIAQRQGGVPHIAPAG